MIPFHFLEMQLGLRGLPQFGGGGGSGPSAQQLALQTEQANTNANLNLEENEQRKTILNAMQGTRVFRGSALSRTTASNTATDTPALAPGPSGQQYNAPLASAAAGTSLLDEQTGTTTGTAPGGTAGGGRGPSGGGGGGRGPKP